MSKKSDREMKEEILDNLDGIKEFEVSYVEEVFYSKIFKAKSEEELEEKWNNGELEFEGGDICDGDIREESLEIREIKE